MGKSADMQAIFESHTVFADLGAVNKDEDDDDDSELDANKARSYRTIAARLNYISPDRPDIGYAVKEAARNMSKPRVSDFQKLRKIGRYL